MGKWNSGRLAQPKLREAEILYHLDHLDATINMLDNALSRTEPGSFTERIFGLDNTVVLQPFSNRTHRK